jgi:uracil-DNA glycosylase
MGFLTLETAVSKAPPPRLPACGKCGLFRGCKSPKMPVVGGGRKRILVVGEAPGADEDDRNRPFVGITGQDLRRELSRNGVDLDRDCWTVNAARCRPKDNKLPDAAVDHCRPLVLRDVERLRPEVIILLGGSAVDSVIGHLWRESPGPVSRWVGWQIPCRRWNAWVCPTYHPSYVKRSEDARNPVPRLFYERHLKAACRLKGRPWPDGVPEDAVTVEMDPDSAAAAVDEFNVCGGEVAFDYETSMLKPDHPDAQIVCCSISDGADTIAYPWHGKAIEATKKVLINPDVKKIGYNCKFESRWTEARLGCKVRGWVHDGMIAAHALDSRSGITSLKFQAFVRLGVEDWSETVKPYLRAVGGNTPNRVWDFVRTYGMHALLTYCGLDSLYEFEVCEEQMREMGS